MTRNHWFELLTLALVLISQFNIVLSNYDDYVDQPSYKESLEPYYTNVHDAINKVDYTQPELFEKTFRHLAESDSEHKEIFKTLLMLVDHDSIDGLEPLTKLLKYIKAYLPGYFKQMQVHYGRNNMNKLASLVEAGFEHNQKIEVLDTFDFVFEKVLGVHRGTASKDPDGWLVELWQKLMGFHIDTNDFDVPKMLRAIDELNDNLKPNEDKLATFKAFMVRQCDKLKSYELQLDIVNLAQYYTGRFIENLTLARLSEYQRMCLAWKRHWLQDDIVKNVSEQMTRSGRRQRAKDIAAARKQIKNDLRSMFVSR